jgi:hypothetical protein
MDTKAQYINARKKARETSTITQYHNYNSKLALESH